MSTSLPKLQFLLQDMISNARAIRIQQNINYSFGEKDYITLLDVKGHFEEIWCERDSFMSFNEIKPSNAGDFLMENVIFYFIMRAIQIKDSSFFKEESLQLKDLIFKTIGYIHSKALMDETLEKEREYFDNETNEENKSEIEAFYQLIEAQLPTDEHFDYALGLYIAASSKYMEKKNPYWYLNFKPIIDYAGNAQNTDKFSVLVNEIIVKYFYIFCDLQTTDKKFMHTELNLIERRISNHDYMHKVLPAQKLNDIYHMLCIDSLIRGEKRQRLLEELVAKVFYNDYSIAYSLQSNRDSAIAANEFWKRNLLNDKILTSDIISFKRDDYYTSPSQLFQKIFDEYKNELDKNPGIVVSLYLLSTEMDSDSFFAFFSLEEKNSNDFEIASYYLKKVDFALTMENCYKKYPDLFSGYKDAIKKGKTEECLNLKKEQQNIEFGIGSDLELKKDLLQRFLWLVVFFKCGLYYDNDEDVYKRYSKRDKMLIPFLNGLMDNEYANIDYVNTNFNNLLQEIGVNLNKKIDLSIKNFSDNKNIILLIYNLSRADFSSKEFLISEINAVRELQKDVLHVDRKKIPDDEKRQAEAEEIKEYNKVSNKNLGRLKKIDFGFDLKTYSQRFYPFSAHSFNLKPIYFRGFSQGLFSFGFERNVKCKLFWETDNEYSEEGLNWPAINEKGLKTRYLYRDRNSYTHHIDHSSVNALLDSKSWKNLLRALSSFYLVLRLAIVERISHRRGENIREDDTFFQNLYLQLEVEDIYDILTQWIQEKAQISNRKVWKIFDESKYKVEEGSVFSVEDFLNFIEKNKKGELRLSYSDIPNKIDPHTNIFKDRLERLLKIMFMVNDFDPVDQKHSVKFMDFYSQYNMEISIYLIYMTFALNYCNDVKV